jgi:hypothetical protein
VATAVLCPLIGAGTQAESDCLGASLVTFTRCSVNSSARSVSEFTTPAAGCDDTVRVVDGKSTADGGFSVSPRPGSGSPMKFSNHHPRWSYRRRTHRLIELDANVNSAFLSYIYHAAE